MSDFPPIFTSFTPLLRCFYSHFTLPHCISLLSAPILAEVVCIRPGRAEGVRLERESHNLEGMEMPSDPLGFDVVHCYGHGGAGMSIAWGCAGNVARLAVEAAAEHGQARI